MKYKIYTATTSLIAVVCLTVLYNFAKDSADADIYCLLSFLLGILTGGLVYSFAMTEAIKKWMKGDG